MRINERFEQMEDEIRKLRKEVDALKAGKAETGKAQTGTEAKPAKAAAPRAKKSTGNK